MKLKKSFMIIGVLLSAMLVVRLALPVFLHHVVEDKLNQMPGYVSKIDSISLSLYRGSYQINGIKIQKLNKNIPAPFFSANKIDLSVEWRALLKGALVAKVIAYEPNVNFVTDPQSNNEQLTIDQQWQRIVKSLFPLNFNRVIVHNGSVHYRSFTSEPPFNLYLKKINGDLTNLNNATKSGNRLPSNLVVDGQTMNGAPVKLNVKFNPFTDKPTFYLTAGLQKMDITDTNNFLQYYTKLRVKKGSFSLYIETDAANGNISGYAKPIFKNLEIDDPNTANPAKIIYNAAAKTAAALLKNSETKAVATKVDITGRIDNPDTSVLSVISYLFHNAFIQALLPGIDHNIPRQNIYFNRNEGGSLVRTASN